MMKPDKKRVSIVLTIVAVLLLVHGAVFAEFKIGFWGLFGSFPITFWVGLGFLTVASVILWISEGYHSKLLFLQLLVLLVALWLVPVAIGGSPPFTNHTLRSSGLIEHVARTGDLSANTLFYLCWPGAFVFPALIAKVFAMNFEPIINYAPFIMQLLYFFPLYVFLKNLFGGNRNYCWAAMWLFYLANWVGEAYFASTTGVGLLLLLILLALVTRPPLLGRENKSPVVLASIVIVFGLLAATHLLTSLIALCIVGVVVLFNRTKMMAAVFGVCLVLLVAWNLTWAMPNTRAIFSSWIGESTSENVVSSEGVNGDVNGDGVIINGDEPIVGLTIPQGFNLTEKGRSFLWSPENIMEAQVSSHLSGNASHIAVGKIRIFFSLVFIILGIIGFLLAWRDKEKRKKNLLVLLVLLVPLLLIFFCYGGRMINRLYLVSLPVMAYFGATLFRIKFGSFKKKLILMLLCLLLILSIPAHMIAHYGNESFDYVSSDQMRGIEHFQEIAPEGFVTSPTYPWAKSNMEKYRYFPLYLLRWEDNVLLRPIGDEGDLYWLIITRQDKEFYRLVYDDTLFIRNLEEMLDNTPNCCLVYSNPDFRLYSLEFADK